MKTYLVPIDFSATSINAAEYAARLSRQTDVIRITLLHSYFISVYQSVLPTPDMVILSDEEIEGEAEEKLRELTLIRLKLLKLVRNGVAVDIKLSRLSLTRSIIETVEEENVSLIILGSNGTDNSSNSHVGTNAINISKLSPEPVIVVPPGCIYEPVRRVVMACDFQKITETFPLLPLKRMLARHDSELLVVNIAHQERHGHASLQQLAEESALHEMLKAYHPRYYYNEAGDVINGILDFAKIHHAQMVISLPHKYSFFQSLLHHSVSSGLTVHSAIPVLLLK
jgi:nucleotide-binding universal stress UspA family protein